MGTLFYHLITPPGHNIGCKYYISEVDAQLLSILKQCRQSNNHFYIWMMSVCPQLYRQMKNFKSLFMKFISSIISKVLF